MIKNIPGTMFMVQNYRNTFHVTCSNIFVFFPLNAGDNKIEFRDKHKLSLLFDERCDVVVSERELLQFTLSNYKSVEIVIHIKSDEVIIAP